jgi:hypothetical protein
MSEDDLARESVRPDDELMDDMDEHHEQSPRHRPYRLCVVDVSTADLHLSSQPNA